jgi:hypothetical protein
MDLRFACVLALLTTIGLNNAAAQQQQATSPTAYAVLHKEWKTEVNALADAVPELSSSEKRDRMQDISTRYTPRFVEFAKDHLNDDLWLNCLIWASVEGTPGEALDAMFDILRDNADRVSNTLQLQLLMSEFIEMNSERINPALSAITEDHGSAAGRAVSELNVALRRPVTASFCRHTQNLSLHPTFRTVTNRMSHEKDIRSNC